ncbi:hypothetical protein ACFOD1_02795 [Pseudidiomarina halophila]|uniref:DNA-binding protein n=1 Tax=Pseudidiomarina halophila TaxID=1449799 RepID=A0A432XYU3_9GAMM|nr:hypothetical protein [Pseudidiomarina halophila]RUO53886.1 hypothetical protein CWI69_00130 [Pseudidiomarina halophila]
MNSYEFSLRFDVADCGLDHDEMDDRLFDSGCDDALVRHGRKAELLIEFDRQGATALETIETAKRQVIEALPEARLLEAKPDFVSPTDIAQVYGLSRQRVQILMQTQLARIHAFTCVGNTQVFRLVTVIDELTKQGKQDVDDTVREAAFAAMQMNRENELAQI